ITVRYMQYIILSKLTAVNVAYPKRRARPLPSQTSCLAAALNCKYATCLRDGVKQARAVGFRRYRPEHAASPFELSQTCNSCFISALTKPDLRRYSVSVGKIELPWLHTAFSTPVRSSPTMHSMRSPGPLE